MCAEKVFRRQPASSNTILRPAALNIVSSVTIMALTSRNSLTKQREPIGKRAKFGAVITGKRDPPRPLQHIAAVVPSSRGGAPSSPSRTCAAGSGVGADGRFTVRSR